MHVLLLAVAVQVSSVYPGARAQDSAYAGDALLHGLVELEQVADFTDRTLPFRYIRQLTTWGADDLAWSLAARLDTAGGPARNRTYPYTTPLAENLLAKHDTLAVERRLAALSLPARDGLLSRLSMRFSCSAPHLRWVLARVQAPFERAKVIEQSSHSCVIGNDTTKRRQALRTAANLIQLDTSRFARGHALNWLIQLRRIGGEAGTAELVRVAAGPQPPSWQEYHWVALLLIEAGDRESALPLLDSAQALRPNFPMSASERVAMHDLRATRADSAAAKVIRDSIVAARPPSPSPPPPPPTSSMRSDRPGLGGSVVYIELSRGDTLRLRDALTDAMRYSAGISVLITATGWLQSHMLSPTPDPYQWERDSRLRLAKFLFGEAMRLSENLEPIQRDSARAGAIGLLAIINVDSALDVAQHTFHEPRFRDRALANTLLVLARIDADRAEALAASLRDPIARDLIYPELVERALASGRLAAAATLAERTVGNEARVRTRLAIVAAELGARRSTVARTRLAAILPEIDPLWHCQKSCEPTLEYRPPEPERDQRIIGQFAMRAIDLGMMHDLNRWAKTRGTPERRAAAWLTIAEAIAEQRLGVYPDYKRYF